MLKESESKESRGWKYKELTFDFEEYEQISMLRRIRMSYLNTDLRIFKFDDGEQHWIVAENKEDAVKWFENEYVGGELEEGYEVEEVPHNNDYINCSEDEELLAIKNKYKAFNRDDPDEVDNNSCVPLWLYLKYWIVETELREEVFKVPNLIACSVY